MTKNHECIGVTFKSSDDQLVCMYTNVFSNVKDAKKAIKEDAKQWIKVHGNAMSKWMSPEDYYMAVGNDGKTCIWQYFTITIAMNIPFNMT